MEAPASTAGLVDPLSAAGPRHWPIRTRTRSSRVIRRVAARIPRSTARRQAPTTTISTRRRTLGSGSAPVGHYPRGRVSRSRATAGAEEMSFETRAVLSITVAAAPIVLLENNKGQFIN